MRFRKTHLILWGFCGDEYAASAASDEPGLVCVESDW